MNRDLSTVCSYVCLKEPQLAIIVIPADQVTIISLVVTVVMVTIIIIPLVILRFVCQRAMISAANRSEARLRDDVLGRLRQQASLARAANGTTTVANSTTAANSTTRASITSTPAPLCTVSLSVNPNHVEPEDPTMTEAPPPAYNVALQYPSVAEDSLSIQPPPPSYHESPSDLQPPPPPPYHEL